MTTAVHTYCTLCGVGCPSVITVDGSHVLSLEPDREHPQGGAICAKGRAAPEVHEHAHRIDYPLRRTKPKTSGDPGWERIPWSAALDLVAAKMLAVRAESGPQAVAFGRGTGGGTGLSPAEPWVQRLAGFFGSPNYLTNTHLCNWTRDGIAYHTLGLYPMPAPEVARSGAILLWGHNPSATSLGLATGTVAARARGAKLVVVDPRRTGLANKADVVLQVRPGSDGALALALIDELLSAQLYDDRFVRTWTNAPLLVREDTGRLLAAADVPALAGAGAAFVAFAGGAPVGYAPDTGAYGVPAERLDLAGDVTLALAGGAGVRCRTVFARLREMAAACGPDRAERITGVPAAQMREAVHLLAANRPVSHFFWNGVVQHTNATQACRAIEIFYVLLGDFDRPGGNVIPVKPRTRDFAAGSGLSSQQAALRLGHDERPLGPPSVPPGNIAAYDLFDAILDRRPYGIRALLSFGGNTLINSGDSLRAREAFEKLEFFAQVDLFHTPTNHYADVLLPATSFLEAETLMVKDGMAQRRPRAVAPLHERHPDVETIFALATRLGLGAHFSGGNVAAEYDEVLRPAGLTWAGMLDHPEGVRVSPEQRYEKFAELDAAGRPVGFGTPTRKVEIFSDAFAAEGQDPLPGYVEPAESPLSTPDLAREYPLVLTNAKRPHYLHSQHRGITGMRRIDPDPTVEINPETAARCGVADGEWVMVETPRGRVHAKADVTASIVPGVVCGNHGWWEAAEELGRPALDPFTEEGANLNLLVHNDQRDPISGGVPHRSTLCRLVPSGPPSGYPR